MKEKNYIKQLKSAIKTTICFSVFCWLLPFIITTCIAVSLARKFWLLILRNRYPYLEFAKTNNIRSLVDTSRNPGVFHILLKVEGNCDFNAIKDKFRQHIVDRVDKLGRLIFPRLKLTLISCWGHYAWIKNFEDFDINNHILLSPNTFKGRLITDNNIQEYVSEIVSKYMPHDYPPWQIYVIPVNPTFSSATEDDFCHNFPASYYILTRIHHLIAEEERNLLISDILMLNTTQKSRVKKSKFPVKIAKQKSPFWQLATKPHYIPELIGCISTTLRNRWNEFIYHFDPLENMSSPDGDKCVKSIVQLLAIVLIVCVSVVKTLTSDKDKNNFFNVLKREVERRKLTWNVAFVAVLASLDPLKILQAILVFVVWCTTEGSKACVREGQTLIGWLILGQRPKTNTLVGLCWHYFPLLIGSLQEIWQIVVIAFQTPRQIYEELMNDDENGDSPLKNMALCGRKVVAWSDKIERSVLLDKIIQSKASETEILLATTSGAMRSFFESFDGAVVPGVTNISARCVLDEYLFGRMNYREGVGGVVGMKFPIVCPSHQTLRKIHINLNDAREKQIGLYLLTFSQTHFDFLTNIFPMLWMRIVVNYLSRKYAIAVTEVVSGQSGDKSEPKTTIWGHTVTDAIYFRTPQSNLSLSLTIQRFGNHVRLGVMADAQISPHHNRLANVWARQFEEI